MYYWLKTISELINDFYSTDGVSAVEIFIYYTQLIKFIKQGGSIEFPLTAN